MTDSDEALLDQVQRAAFSYFTDYVNPVNGLVADTSREGAPASIAVAGFALSCYPVAVERGWMSRADALARTLAALRFFRHSEQSKQRDATGWEGFYYHFLDMKRGRRTWKSELSVMDTALLIAGVLCAAAYFGEDTPDERELRDHAVALYRRVNWRWAHGNKPTTRQGWTPESGFLHYGWDGYDEAAILYVLGLASPTHAMASDSYHAWTAKYEWKTVYDIDYLYAGPLFIHQFSHAWIDFAGIQDHFMREKGIDYFENSRRATLIHREYATRNPDGFAGYGPDCWGLTANDGPGFKTEVVGGQKRRFMGYAARGAPFGPDDGTIGPGAALASIPFAPDETLAVLRHFRDRYPDMIRDWRLPGGFNPSLPGPGPAGWVADACFGLDQGLAVMMIENFRTGLIWRLMKTSPRIRPGLRLAGFTGGWVEAPGT